MRTSVHTIPGDPEHSVFKFVIVAAKRARQLQAGHRPTLLMNHLSSKPTVAAMEETRRGLVPILEKRTS